MTRMQVYNRTKDSRLGGSIRAETGFFPRLKGLIGRGCLAEGEGLWLSPCHSIHSFGMAFEFDALFLDGTLNVVALYSSFRRNRVSRIFWNARGVLELPEGTIERTGTEVGDEIVFQT